MDTGGFSGQGVREELEIRKDAKDGG